MPDTRNTQPECTWSLIDGQKSATLRLTVEVFTARIGAKGAIMAYAVGVGAFLVHIAPRGAAFHFILFRF